VSDPVLRPYAGSFTNDAHNDLLQLWAESGIVGLVIWLGALGAFFVMVRNLLAALRRDRRARANGEFEAKTFEVQGPAVLLLGAGAGLTVFVLDGMMSFPMWLPAHFAMAAFFLSVPGVVVRILAQERRAAHAPGSLRGLRARQRSLRLGGVGVLLALAACVWHFSHRVRAEYHLKTGRNMAEANILPTPGGLASPWAVCDSAYRGWLMELAQGQSDSELKALLDQMNVVADVEPMQAAREQFERALAADRWYANASSRLAQLLLFQGHYRQSIEVSGRTLKTLEAYEVHERIGAAAYLAGDHKLARDEWQICGMRRAGVADYYEALIQRTKR